MNRNLIAVCTWICAQSYEKRRAFIIAENPMQTTVEAFWQMIWEQKCVLVIMFSDCTEICEVYMNSISIYVHGGFCPYWTECFSPCQETCFCYWPTSIDSNSMQFGSMQVTLCKEAVHSSYSERQLLVTDTKVSNRHKYASYYFQVIILITWCPV